MSFYVEMAQTALELLGEFGQQVTIVRESGASIDPVTGATTPGTIQSWLVNGVMRAYPDAVIDGARIATTDRKLIIDSQIAPILSDTVIVGGESWHIESITTVSPAGIALAYMLQVRR